MFYNLILSEDFCLLLPVIYLFIYITQKMLPLLQLAPNLLNGNRLLWQENCNLLSFLPQPAGCQTREIWNTSPDGDDRSAMR